MKNISLLIVLSLFLSCDDNNIPECAETACTLDFRTLIVQIKNSNDEPVALDGFEVINLENQVDLTREYSASEFEFMRENGTYPLFGDEYSQQYQNKEIDIKFVAYINGEEVISSNYKVGANCCHIYFVSGNRDLILP